MAGCLNHPAKPHSQLLRIWLIMSSKTERACANRNARLLDFVRYGRVRRLHIGNYTNSLNASWSSIQSWRPSGKRLENLCLKLSMDSASLGSVVRRPLEPRACMEWRKGKIRVWAPLFVVFLFPNYKSLWSSHNFKTKWPH